MYMHISFQKKLRARQRIISAVFTAVPWRRTARWKTFWRWGDQYGVDRFVVHSVATTAKQVDSINAFLAEQVQSNPSRLIGFAALHPESNRIPQQVEERFRWGLPA